MSQVYLEQKALLCCELVPQCTPGGERTTLCIPFSPSTLTWVLGIELRLQDLHRLCLYPLFSLASYLWQHFEFYWEALSRNHSSNSCLLQVLQVRKRVPRGVCGGGTATPEFAKNVSKGCTNCAFCKGLLDWGHREFFACSLCKVNMPLMGSGFRAGWVSLASSGFNLPSYKNPLGQFFNFCHLRFFSSFKIVFIELYIFLCSSLFLPLPFYPLPWSHGPNLLRRACLFRLSI